MLRPVLVSVVLVAGGAAAASPRRVTSNVLRADYAGSRECSDCHADIAKKFATSPMQNRTRAVDATTVIRAPFDGATWSFKGLVATMVEQGGKKVMRFAGKEYRVTRVIGGRTREDFVGVAGDGAPEQVLPISYVYSTKSWRYKGYSVMVRERPVLQAGPVWRQTCIFCHNTPP